MDKIDLKKVFLSASIPDPERDQKYYKSADIIAIRDAVRAFATVVIPSTEIIWGGHPTITPLIRSVVKRFDVNIRDHVTIYQSDFFEAAFPQNNSHFENIKTISKSFDKESSLVVMREAMISENNFQAGVFIGGMEGVEKEFKMFTTIHPDAIVFPVASTGAAAKIIYEKLPNMVSKRLKDDYAYMALFKELLMNVIMN